MELPPRLMNLIDIVDLYKNSKNNRDTLRKHLTCGCFHCKKIFQTNEITDWTDNGETARCPFCKVDSVVVSTPNWQLTDEVLEILYKYHFKR